MRYDLNSLNRNTKKYNYFNEPISSPVEDVSVFGHSSALLRNSGNSDENDEEMMNTIMNITMKTMVKPPALLRN